MGKGKVKRDKKTSKGGRVKSRINRTIRRLEMKVKRWERYLKEEVIPVAGSKREGWDTTGLKKHIALLRGVK